MPKTPAGEESLRTFIARVVFSGIVLAVALYVIVFGDTDADRQKWAIGVVGVVLGYWLK